MYFKRLFKVLDYDEIAKYVRKEGFDPIKVSNQPGFIYPEHKHPETKLLVFITGSMMVSVDNQTYHCQPGDKLVIAGNTEHSAVVGENGCEFFWSEKVL